MTPDEWHETVRVALVMELDEMQRTGATEARLDRAEFYLAWLRGEA